MKNNISQSQKGVVLGRFAPLHKGHQLIIDRVIKDFGIKNSLVIIGSSTSYNLRTPYTLGERKVMINTIYPLIKVSDIEDINKTNEHFLSSSLNLWLDNLKAMQYKLNSEFVFYGGSSEDIKYLSKHFKTKVVVDRNKSKKKISATVIRKLLEKNNYKDLEKYLDARIIPFAIKGYDKFRLLAAKQFLQ